MRTGKGILLEAENFWLRKKAIEAITGSIQLKDAPPSMPVLEPQSPLLLPHMDTFGGPDPPMPKLTAQPHVADVPNSPTLVQPRKKKKLVKFVAH